MTKWLQFWMLNLKESVQIKALH